MMMMIELRLQKLFMCLTRKPLNTKLYLLLELLLPTFRRSIVKSVVVLMVWRVLQDEKSVPLSFRSLGNADDATNMWVTSGAPHYDVVETFLFFFFCEHFCSSIRCVRVTVCVYSAGFVVWLTAELVISIKYFFDISLNTCRCVRKVWCHQDVKLVADLSLGFVVIRATMSICSKGT